MRLWMMASPHPIILGLDPRIAIAYRSAVRAMLPRDIGDVPCDRTHNGRASAYSIKCTTAFEGI